MIEEREEQRFLFNAHGVGLAGEITAPFKHVIAAQASTSLAITGGAAKAEAGPFAYEGLVSFERAATVTTGIYSSASDAWETLITVRVEKLNLLNMVTADAVVARLTSIQPRKGERPGKAEKGLLPEPSILPIGSYFENLRIAGQPVELTVNERCFSDPATYSVLARGLAVDEKMKSIQQRIESPLAQDQWIGSIFSKVEKCGSGSIVQGNKVQIPGFGTVYLGEFVIAPSQRSITMLRIKLGCPVAGNVLMGYAAGNGMPYPPYRS